MDADGGFGLGATITVQIPELETAKVRELARVADEMCPYSRATRGNIETEIIAVGD